MLSKEARYLLYLCRSTRRLVDDAVKCKENNLRSAAAFSHGRSTGYRDAAEFLSKMWFGRSIDFEY